MPLNIVAWKLCSCPDQFFSIKMVSFKNLTSLYSQFKKMVYMFVMLFNLTLCTVLLSLVRAAFVV